MNPSILVDEGVTVRLSPHDARRVLELLQEAQRARTLDWQECRRLTGKFGTGLDRYYGRRLERTALG